MSKLENIVSIGYVRNGDTDTYTEISSFDRQTGIALYENNPEAICYFYNTNSPNNDLLCVVIKSTMNIAILERENEYNNLFDDMNDNSYLDSSGNAIKENDIVYVDLSAYSKKGFAADGNSRLILRVQTETPGTVTFSLNNDIGATLEQLTNRKNKSTSLLQVNTTEINSELYQASAVLIAPETFPNKKNFPSDKFKINVQFTPDDPEEDSDEENIELVIKAAPILLIPGMFDNAEKTFGIAGNLGIYRSLIANGYEKDYVHFWNYDISQGPNTLLQLSYNDLFMKIVRILNQYFDEKIVCTKVDMITHGMGGLMARKFLSEENKNSDGNNWSTISYKQGMVRRLITVGL